ncbi:MAG: phytanoyl-CoA dioxygenase family protein [Planctomycetota bacterium]|nr:phytanoyl-CoA dioxygenase family protein [Planctomycetota bacterium]MDA1139820.1 phytanoyl-CoA dioxygenase family protein [Planctomycetota bacterium]
MELSPQQLHSFKVFGFLVVPQFLTPDHVQALRDAVSALKAEESGEPDPIKHQGRVVGMFHKDRLLQELFDQPGLLAIARQLLDDPPCLRFLGDEYVSYSTPADWHPDMSPNQDFEALKYGFYLDDLSRGGCLRVVPGSHNPAFSDSLGTYRKSSEPSPDFSCAHPCMVMPGDLLIFNLKLWHQGTANPNGTHRRVIFWSVGQGQSESFRKFATGFHEKVGRGTDNDSWPDFILDHAPLARREMLDVYAPGTTKQCELELGG